MIPYGRSPVLYPCAGGRPGNELLIVEGDSAAKSVDAIRDPRRQAILAMQGKPLNALRASNTAVANNPILSRLCDALLAITGPEPRSAIQTGTIGDRLADPENCVYQSVTLLMDPDADGIHCGVLLMGFFERFLPALVDHGRLRVIRPPMFLLKMPDDVALPIRPGCVPGHGILAQSPDHAVEIENALRDANVPLQHKVRYRGLGSLPPSLLKISCIDPATRTDATLTRDEIRHATRMFTGESV